MVGMVVMRVYQESVCVCLCVHMCMCVHLYVYTYFYVCICIPVNVYIYVCIHTYVIYVFSHSAKCHLCEGYSFLMTPQWKMHVSETQAHLPLSKRSQGNSGCALGGQGLRHNCFRHFLKPGCEDASAGLSQSQTGGSACISW